MFTRFFALAETDFPPRFAYRPLMRASIARRFRRRLIDGSWTPDFNLTTDTDEETSPTLF